MNPPPSPTTPENTSYNQKDYNRVWMANSRAAGKAVKSKQSEKRAQRSGRQKQRRMLNRLAAHNGLTSAAALIDLPGMRPPMHPSDPTYSQAAMDPTQQQHLQKLMNSPGFTAGCPTTPVKSTGSPTMYASPTHTHTHTPLTPQQSAAKEAYAQASQERQQRNSILQTLATAEAKSATNREALATAEAKSATIREAILEDLRKQSDKADIGLEQFQTCFSVPANLKPTSGFDYGGIGNDPYPYAPSSNSYSPLSAVPSRAIPSSLPPKLPQNNATPGSGGEPTRLVFPEQTPPKHGAPKFKKGDKIIYTNKNDGKKRKGKIDGVVVHRTTEGSTFTYSIMFDDGITNKECENEALISWDDDNDDDSL